MQYILFSVFFFLAPTLALACSCDLVQFGTDKQEVARAKGRADAVFAGKVIEVVERKDKWIETVFEIAEVWKGNLTSRIILYRGTIGGCSFRFQTGRKYLVYAHSYRSEEKQVRFSAGFCSRTNTEDPEMSVVDRKYLGKSVKPKSSKE